MRTSCAGLLVLALIGSPARPLPLRHSARAAAPAQTVSAAAARIAAPFGIVTSVYRTIEHNREVGGVPNSYHLLGQAIDVVRRRGVSHAQVAAALTAAGFRLIESLDEGDHSHFAFSPAWPRSAAAPAPSRPAPPRAVPKPLVAADQHGTLLLDAGRQPASAATATPPPMLSGH